MFTKSDTKRMKGIAILLLLFHHLFYSSSRIESNHVQFIFLNQSVVEYVATLCRVCVWIFVFLSAYGLSYQYIHAQKTTVSKFILKKWLSLIQPFLFIYVCIAIAYSISVGSLLDYYKGKIIYLVLDMFGWADFFGTPMLLGAWWYMCLAQILLFLLPALFEICRKLEWISVLIIFIGMQFLSEGIQSTFGGDYLNYLLVAVVGILFAQKGVLDCWKSRQVSHIKNFSNNIIFLLLLVTLLMIKEYIKPVDSYHLGGFLCAVGVIGISLISSRIKETGIVGRILENLGQHSGNIFMIHSFFYIFFPITVYWSRNVFMSWLCLILMTYIISWGVEWLKKISYYNLLFLKIKEKL